MTKIMRKHKTLLVIVSIVVLVSVVAFLLCRNFRYYSAETVNKYFEKYDLYTIAYDTPIKGLVTCVHSSDFEKCTPGVDSAEVYARFGEPHARHGSGLVSDVYFTTDGYLIYILYHSNGIQLTDKLKLQSN